MKRLNDFPGDGYDSSDTRDQALGAALRRAVGSLADVDEAALRDMAERAVATASGAFLRPVGVPFQRLRSSLRRVPLAAAAAVIVGVGAAGAGVGIGLSGRADARGNAYLVASAILPEYSRWFPEAMSGDADPAGPMAEFVESLWSAGASTGGEHGPFGPVY